MMALDSFPPTRTAALERLSAFLPRAGRHYAARRNYDLGPGRHHGVSGLSPYLRCRLITEEEVLQAVLARHAPQAAEKFIQEVFWRTYWKGWLELRPGVWDEYRRDLRRQWDDVQTQAGLRDRWEAACTGDTGIACFDGWADELVNTGYLHNHARMWFASIWIFTLELPWELGADFFLRHLLDGDPASNTLGWRWVAGIQTVGKTYLARPDNIAKYTEGRFGVPGRLAGYGGAIPG
ncbi:FAD-binding domain-containing protein, partial [Roseobacter sinensis]